MPTLGYPLDLTGAAPSNLVVNEIHTFTSAPTRLFVPAAGPFYTTTLDIRNNATNAVLQPNTDYKLLHLHREGTIASGKQICAVIYVMNLDITAIRIQYQCIGDNYADTSDTIRDLLSGSPPPNPSIAWGHVFGAPVQFAPAEHLHHVDEVYGMQEVVSALEQLRVATLSGDGFAFDAIYQYLANLFANYDWVTQQELANAINTATVNPYGTVRSYRTFAELRAETNITNDAGTIYICAGRASLLDGQGRSFVWNKNSNAVDNDETVLQPTIIGVGQSGRMQVAMRLEFDVRNLAQRLGRRIGTTGIIETDLSTIASLGTTNLDALVTSGVYWVSSATGGRPADVDSGVIIVERSHINNVIQTLHVHTSNTAPPDDDVTRTNVVIQHRSGSRNVDTDAMTWTPWESMFSRTRAVVNGIDTELALTRSTDIDINTIARSSSYWVLSTAPNTPFMSEDCVLNVHCIDATRTMQHAITVGYEAWRLGYDGVDYVDHTWTGWTYRANRNGDANQVFNVKTLTRPNALPNHAVNVDFLDTEIADIADTIAQTASVTTVPSVILATIMGRGGRYWANPYFKTYIGSLDISGHFVQLEKLCIYTDMYAADKTTVDPKIAIATTSVDVTAYPSVNAGRTNLWNVYARPKPRDVNTVPIDAKNVNPDISDMEFTVHGPIDRAITSPPQHVIWGTSTDPVVHAQYPFHSQTEYDDFIALGWVPLYVISSSYNTPFITLNDILLLHLLDSSSLHVTTADLGGSALRTFKAANPVAPDDVVNLQTLTSNLTTAIANIQTDAPNLGIVIRYYGQTSILMPCYIGEDFFGVSSNVKISGVTKSVSILDIEPAKIEDYGTGLYYVYLVETSPNVYKLIMYTAMGQGRPKFPASGNMTQTRKHLYHPSDNPATSNRLFLGLAQVVSNHFEICRNWFQDTGFIEYYHAMAQTYEEQALPSQITTRQSGGIRHFAFDGTCSSGNGDFSFDNSVINEPLKSLPLLIWGGERVQVDFYSAIAIDDTVVASGCNISLFLVGIQFGSGSFSYSSPVPNIHKLSHVPGNMSQNNRWDTVSVSTYIYEPTEALYSVYLQPSVLAATTTVVMKGAEPSGFVHNTLLKIAYEQVHSFRELAINAIDPAYWFPNSRTILLSGDVFDLDLKAYHDSVYGGPAPANCTVEFIVQSGCLVCSSTTTAYAVTNPNTWASGVVTKLTIQNGGAVSGRGGNGGRGGRSWSEWIDANNDTYYTYIGGAVTIPTSHVHGKNGGNAIRTYRPLIITNLGFISVGSGGGGGSGGGEVRFNTAGTVSRINLSGNGGGGGWPYGAGGLPGQIIESDNSQADYYVTAGGGGYSIWMTSGNVGVSSQGLSGLTTLASGGGVSNRTNGDPNVLISHGEGGGGGLVYLNQYSTGGGGSSWGGLSGTLGDAGNGGNEGTYAINSTGGSVTFVGAQGQIFGTVA